MNIKKFFSYENSANEIAGIFTVEHYIYLAVFFSAIFLALYLCRNISKKAEKRIRFVIALSVTTMEIIKIILRLRVGMGPEAWMPLYFCSVFILASLVSNLPFEPRKTAFEFSGLFRL